MLIIALIALIVLMLAIFTYVFLVRPAINAQAIGWANKGYEQGQIDMINAVLSQIQQNGYVQIPAGENQTIILVPYQPQG